MAARLIGVDLGGTKVSSAVLGADGLSTPVLVATETSSQDQLVEQLAQVILAAADGDEECRIGLGVPAVVEFATGRARYAPNIPLHDVALREVLSERTGLPVVVDNDATVAALAEAHDEHGELVHPDLVMLTIGTGVGGGVIVGGRIFRGATGAAPELGHILVGLDLADGAPPAGPRFPQAGSLERLASGRQLDELGRHRGYADGPEVVAAAERGEAGALDALRILGERLGIGIASVLHCFEPPLVCIGGGASAAGELLLEPARRVVAAWTLPGVAERTEIRAARWGPQAGVRGAALLARQDLFDEVAADAVGSPA
jgi:glucokinase